MESNNYKGVSRSSEFQLQICRLNMGLCQLVYFKCMNAWSEIGAGTHALHYVN